MNRHLFDMEHSKYGWINVEFTVVDYPEEGGRVTAPTGWQFDVEAYDCLNFPIKDAYKDDEILEACLKEIEEYYEEHKLGYYI